MLNIFKKKKNPEKILLRLNPYDDGHLVYISYEDGGGDIFRTTKAATREEAAVELLSWILTNKDWLRGRYITIMEETKTGGVEEIKIDGQHQLRIKFFRWEFIITIVNWRKVNKFLNNLKNE